MKLLIKVIIFSIINLVLLGLIAYRNSYEYMNLFSSIMISIFYCSILYVLVLYCIFKFGPGTTFFQILKKIVSSKPTIVAVYISISILMIFRIDAIHNDFVFILVAALTFLSAVIMIMLNLKREQITYS